MAQESAVIFVYYLNEFSVRGRQRVFVDVQTSRDLEDPTFKQDFRMSKPLFEVINFKVFVSVRNIYLYI